MSTSNTSSAAARSATPAGSRASRSSGEPPATAMAVTSSFTAVVGSAVSSTSRLSELKCVFVVKRSNDPMAW
jgi:hypothetical protein